MGLNIFPKNVITGKTSKGEKFEAFEYDYNTYSLLQIGPLIGTLLVGGIFSAISGFIVLIMLMILFNGRFNPVSLAVPILSGFWLWDAHTGFIFSALLNIFIETEGLIFLSKVNFANICVISVIVFLGPTIVRIINDSSNDIPTRYFLFFIGMAVLYIISFRIAGNYIDTNWIGMTHIIVE